MDLLITGICGFAGSSIALQLLKEQPGISMVGVDNFMRAGSEVKFGWRPATSIGSILEEIARHAELHPQSLELTTCE